MGRVKKPKVISTFSIDRIENVELEMDVICGMCNLKVLFRQNYMDMIAPAPAGAATRSAGIVNSQIFTTDLKPDLKIPAPSKMSTTDIPAHIQSFDTAMSWLLPGLEKTFKLEEDDYTFTGRVQKRGENLQNGGYVLQVRVQDLGDDLWRVQFTVAASMKFPIYKCHIELKRALPGVIHRSVCYCKNG